MSAHIVFKGFPSGKRNQNQRGHKTSEQLHDHVSVCFQGKKVYTGEEKAKRNPQLPAMTRNQISWGCAEALKVRYTFLLALATHKKRI